MAEKKSELQKAADRVRDAQENLEDVEKKRAAIKIEYDRCKIELERAARQLEYLTDECYTARNCVTRELQSIRNLTGVEEVEYNKVLASPY